MEDNSLVQSSFSAKINALMRRLNILAWCFALPESECQNSKHAVLPTVDLS